jgi:hypothetical protein
MKSPSRSLVFAASMAGLILSFGPVLAQGGLVSSDPVAAVDNIPPGPATSIRAVDTPADSGQSITLSWNLSADDAVSFTVFNGTVVPRGDVRGYRIYRATAGAADALVATVASGVKDYVDRTVTKDLTYVYTVRPFDLDNETNPSITAGSAEDLARMGKAIDNTVVTPPPVVAPVGADGSAIVGWFSRQGDRVGFADFFLFADHFGQSPGDAGFDAGFDLVANGKVDFADFFLFADNFGKVIANADQVRASAGP